jgi:hypothetical protein
VGRATAARSAFKYFRRCLSRCTFEVYTVGDLGQRAVATEAAKLGLLGVESQDRVVLLPLGSEGASELGELSAVHLKERETNKHARHMVYTQQRERERELKTA